MAKNDSMLAILWMLHSGSIVTAKQISEKLELHIRTVYRYIDALCASGVPIISDSGHHGGYSLQHDFIKAPLLFDAGEQKALFHAAVFAKEAGYPFDEALHQATLKIKTYLNQDQKTILNRHLAGFEVVTQPGTALIKETLVILEQAIAEECSIEIEYRTGRDGHSKRRTVDPYGMLYWNNKWYFIAFCHLRNAIRSFRVERVRTIMLTETTFKRPEGFSGRDFFIKSLLPDLEKDQELCSVIIQGREEALDDLCLHWFMGHHLQKRVPMKAVFLIEESLLHSYVPYFLLAYGKAIRVVEPLSLKEHTIEILSGLIKYYQEEQLP